MLCIRFWIFLYLCNNVVDTKLLSTQVFIIFTQKNFNKHYQSFALNSKAKNLNVQVNQQFIQVHIACKSLFLLVITFEFDNAARFMTIYDDL